MRLSLPVLLVSHEAVSELVEEWDFLLGLSLGNSEARLEAVDGRKTLIKARAGTEEVPEEFLILKNS